VRAPAIVAVGLVLASCTTPSPTPEPTETPTLPPTSEPPAPTEAVISTATPTLEPTPTPTLEPTPTPTLTIRLRSPRPVRITVRVRPGRHRVVSGVATWYATGRGKGYAAAGPALRRALGTHWRGTQVRVCARSRCVAVVLNDWCFCARGHRVVDLSNLDFARLAPLGRGVIPVTVTR
jgi:rare lipoprotein A (peptidoglycan hydrolase)